MSSVSEPAADIGADPQLGELRLNVAGRELTLPYRTALITWLDEQRFLSVNEPRQYGMVLWPASIALALEIGRRRREFAGKRVLELGAGLGLAGLAAAAVGARVLQTDRDADALAVCRENAERHHLSIDTRVGDWAAYPELGRFDWVIAADVLYRSRMHEQLLAIIAASLAPGGRVLVADPLRSASVRFFEGLEGSGWRLEISRWTIGEGEGWETRTVGVFATQPPGT